MRMGTSPWPTSRSARRYDEGCVEYCAVPGIIASRSLEFGRLCYLSCLLEQYQISCHPARKKNLGDHVVCRFLIYTFCLLIHKSAFKTIYLHRVCSQLWLYFSHEPSAFQRSLRNSHPKIDIKTSYNNRSNSVPRPNTKQSVFHRTPRRLVQCLGTLA